MVAALEMLKGMVWVLTLYIGTREGKWEEDLGYLGASKSWSRANRLFRGGGMCLRGIHMSDSPVF